MTQATVARVWAQVMDFDPRDYRAVGVSGAPDLEGWLLENSGAWLNPMRRPDINTPSAERVVIVVGEAGSGKTTLLDLIGFDLVGTQSMPFYFDFKNAPSLARSFVDEASAIRAISEYLANSINFIVLTAGLRNAYRAAKMRYVLNRISTPTLDQFQIDYAGLRNYDDKQLLACRDVEEETLAIERDRPEEFIGAVASQFISGCDRAVFLFDNLEGLDARLREVLLRSLSALVQGKTFALVAIRSENQHEAQVLLQGRRDEPYLLGAERASLIEIARIRNAGARAYCVMHPQIYNLAAVEEQYKAFDDSLSIIEGEDYLLSLATNWLNDNVRNLLTLLAELSVSFPTYQGNATRGFVSRRLLERRSHSSLLKIFDPKPVHADKYRGLPFVFLSLRILAYLEKRDSMVLYSVMADDFVTAFGIAENEVRRAIDRFARAEAGKPCVLRIEPRPDGGEHIHLLSCGEAFVRHVVYECDYLQLLFDQIEDPPLIPARLSNDEWVLKRALAVVEKIIIPAFELEHPYIDVKVRATRRVRRRIGEYGRMFSYRHGNWFIGILRARLQAFATPRRLRGVAMPLANRLQEMEDRLNFIARGGR